MSDELRHRPSSQGRRCVDVEGLRGRMAGYCVDVEGYEGAPQGTAWTWRVTRAHRRCCVDVDVEDYEGSPQGTVWTWRVTRVHGRVLGEWWLLGAERPESTAQVPSTV